MIKLNQNRRNHASNLICLEPRQVGFNWERRMCGSALLFLLLVLPVTAEPIESGYAGEKIASPARTNRASVRFALPPSELPKRGVLVTTGNILSPLARWIVLDFDRLTIRQATTRLTDGVGMVQIESERTDTISGDEWHAVISVANEIWSNPDRNLPTLNEPTDRLCSIALFDSDDVLHEFGSVCPRPRLVTALEMVVASVERHTGSSDATSARSPKRAPIGSAHREPNGTLVLRLRAGSGQGVIMGDGELRYVPGDPEYKRVQQHLGPIPPGGTVLVWAFPPAWADEPSLPQ